MFQDIQYQTLSNTPEWKNVLRGHPKKIRGSQIQNANRVKTLARTLANVSER